MERASSPASTRRSRRAPASRRLTDNCDSDTQAHAAGSKIIPNKAGVHPPEAVLYEPPHACCWRPLPAAPSAEARKCQGPADVKTELRREGGPRLSQTVFAQEVEHSGRATRIFGCITPNRAIHMSGPTSVAERHRSWSWRYQLGRIGRSQGKLFLSRIFTRRVLTDSDRRGTQII